MSWGPYSLAEPQWLWLLLLIPIMAFLRGRRGHAPAVRYSSTEIFRGIGALRKSRAGAILASLFFVTWFCLVVAMARPQKTGDYTQIEASGIDIMLALDVSRSMLAEDFFIGNKRINRLVAVKDVTEEFIDQRPNDRIGIVAFAGRPYLVSPLTLDHSWLLKNLSRIEIGLVEDGTAIGSAIASAANRLKDREAKSKVIVLLTDGENNSGKVPPATAAEAAAALGIKIYTIGTGTYGMAPYPRGTDPFGRTVYTQLETEFDEETLVNIAEITDGKYFRATDMSSLEGIFNEIDELEKTESKVRVFQETTELFEWWLVPGLAFLGVHLLLRETLLKRFP